MSLTERHPFYEHIAGSRPAGCELISSWYSKQHLYLLQEMEKVDMGGRSLPDESVVFFGSETFSGVWSVSGPRGGRCYLGGQERGAME